MNKILLAQVRNPGEELSHIGTCEFLRSVKQERFECMYLNPFSPNFFITISVVGIIVIAFILYRKKTSKNYNKWNKKKIILTIVALIIIYIIYALYKLYQYSG